MPPLLPIGNRREAKSRAVVLQDDPANDPGVEGKDSLKPVVPTGGRTSRASQGARFSEPCAGSGPSFLGVPQVGQASVSPHVSPRRSPVVAARSGRVVRFAATPSNEVVEVTPYSQVYGMDPDKFDFNPSAPNGIEWHGEPCAH